MSTGVGLEKLSRARDRALSAERETGAAEKLQDLESPPLGKRAAVATAKFIEAKGAQTKALDEQRKAFAADPDLKRFTLLKDVTVPLGLPIGKDDLQIALMRALPNSPFMRFQRLFCAPEDWIVPPFQATRKGGVTRITFTDNVDRLSLKPCIVDPDMIPHKLAQDLRLADFSDLKRKPVAQMQRKFSSDVIDGLKQVFESLQPVWRNNHRVMVISPPSAGIRAHYPAIGTVDPAIVGKIIYTRAAANGKEESGLVAQFFDGVYSAHRKTVHQGHGYHREINTVKALSERIRVYNRKVDRQWRKGIDADLKAEIKKEGATLAAYCKKELGKCVDKDKVEALGKVLDGLTFEDKRKRENVSIALTKIIASSTRLNARLAQMYPKGRYNGADGIMLLEEYHRHQEIMKAVRMQLAGSEKILNKRLELFSERPLSPAQIRSQANGILLRLDIVPEELRRLRLQPFRSFASLMLEELPNLHNALEERNLRGAKESLIRLYVTAKFSAFEVCKDHIQLQMAEGKSIPVTRAKELITALRGLFDDSRIFNDIVVQDVEPKFLKLSGKLETLESKLSAAAEGGRALAHDSDEYIDLKDYLDEIDVPEMASGLRRAAA